ncbi:hypothetical protein JTB14_030942 [Gonioctena quinquepunctata]|nr:hypothetical protein JTB14_030942 [Gonioctena quinquepunctata]
MESKDGNNAKDASLQIILQQLNALTQSMTEIRNLLLAQNEKIESCLAQIIAKGIQSDAMKKYRPDKIHRKLASLAGGANTDTPHNIQKPRRSWDKSNILEHARIQKH